LVFKSTWSSLAVGQRLFLSVIKWIESFCDIDFHMKSISAHFSTFWGCTSTLWLCNISIRDRVYYMFTLIIVRFWFLIATAWFTLGFEAVLLITWKFITTSLGCKALNTWNFTNVSSLNQWESFHSIRLRKEKRSNYC
jgi:hypothetical protein